MRTQCFFFIHQQYLHTFGACGALLSTNAVLNSSLFYAPVVCGLPLLFAIRFRINSKYQHLNVLLAVRTGRVQQPVSNRHDLRCTHETRYSYTKIDFDCAPMCGIS